MVCTSCGRDNRADARFCDSCGSPLGAGAPERAYAPPPALAEKIRAQGAALEGERKQVTVLFADVSGSMDLAEQVDAETWRRIMDRFFVVLCDAVHRYEGTVVQFTGDGIMALFGAPIAHEDHAVRAGHAALRLTRDLSAHAAQVRRAEGLNFSVRLGLNSGEVVAGAIGDDLRVDFTAIGHTVGLAKRMESLAEPGKAYLTEHTAALLEGFFALEPLGRFEVKGVREPVGVFALAGTGRARTRLDLSRARGFSRFVGRDRELAQLDALLERALDGDGRVAGIVGEAGVGKSRLCHEFADRCRAAGVSVFSASGAAHARSAPFHVALELLRDYFGIEDGMPAQAARERVAGRLLLLDEAFGPKLPGVFDFLGIRDPERPASRMDPDARQRALLAGAREIVTGHAQREAAVYLIEDMHWVDDASRAFIDALAAAAAGTRTLVVLNFRPELEAGWMDDPAYEQLAIVPLGSEALAALLDDLLGAHPSLDGLADEIRTRTGGNPFFVEEVVRALVEDGTLTGPRGAHRLARPLGTLRVPASVHDVLAARIDRLPAEHKELLQGAAVVGREFGGETLKRAAGLEPGALDEGLELLVEAGFLVAGEDGEYAFRHPLTQEVAYGTLLAERRRRTHAAVARALAETDHARLDERSALIAQHFQAAGETLEAARWHAHAATWAGTRDPVHAASHWGAVRALVTSLERTPETIGLGLAACLWTLQFAWRLGIDDAGVDAVHREAHELAEALGDEATGALVTATWASVIGLSRDMGLAVGAAAEAHERVRHLDRPDAEVPILIFLAYGQMVSGDYASAAASCKRAIELTERDPSLGAGVVVNDPHGWFHMMHGFVLMLMGRLDDGRSTLGRAVELTAAAGDLESLGWAHMCHALLGYFSGDGEGVDDHALRSVEIADSIGSMFSRIWARYNLGVAHLVAERHEQAAEVLASNLELIAAHRTGRECEPWTRALLAFALVEIDRAAEGAPMAREALELADRRGVLNVRPFARGALARALWRSGGSEDEATAHFERGIAEAREMGSDSIAAVLTYDLARRTGDPRRLDEARDALTAIGARGRLERFDQEVWFAAPPARAAR